MASLSKKNFFNTHPAGLKTIFFTEMWERFGYYGMRALLVLYMTKEFLFNVNDRGIHREVACATALNLMRLSIKELI